MLGCIVCWGIALGMLFSKSGGIVSDERKIIFSMVYAFFAILCRAVEVYRETHIIELDVTEDENGKLMLNKK